MTSMDGSEVIDQPTEYLVFDDQQQAETPEPEKTEQPTEDKVDGRKFNPDWSRHLKAIKELTAADPENGPKISDMLTKLRDDYARYQDVRSLAPKGVDELRTWKTTLDSLGGAEGAASVLERVASMEQIDAKIEAMDDSFVDELPENLQKGVYGMVPQLLSRLQATDEKAYAAAITPHLQAGLAGTGIEQLLRQEAEKTDDPVAIGVLRNIYAWYQRTMQGAQTSPGTTKPVDPTVARLQAELESRRKGDDEAFVKGIQDTTNSYVADTFTREAAVYLKQFNLTDQQKEDLAESFNAKLTAKLGSDQAFQKQLGAYKNLKNRSAETVNNYIKSKVDENAKSIIDGLVTARYGGMKKKATPIPSETQTTSGGATRVAQAPAQADWDMAKMEALGYAETVKKGIFHLKGGRTVKLATA